jgi:hypothetical protein
MKKLFKLKNSVFATFFTTLLVIGGGATLPLSMKVR